MFNLAKLLNKIYSAETPDLKDMEQVLLLTQKGQLDELFSFADNIRKEFCGDGILLRGIIEFSNLCAQECFYCGLNKSNHRLKRYRMTENELIKAVDYLGSCNIKTLVLQSGQEEGLDALWLRDIILKIKSKFNMAITLSVGEKSADEYRLWKQAGADRYLLKIETSDKALYESIHKGMSFARRMACLDDLRGLGYQVGTGNIIGFAGQSLKTVAKDIKFFKHGNFDMLGIGPFIPHQDTRMSQDPKGDAALCLKTIALARIVTKNTHIPATTALGSLDQDYRVEGLKCGANVLMPNFTPQPYRKLYEIYPGKRCVDEPVGNCNFCMDSMAKNIGRFIDYSIGDSLKFRDGSRNKGKPSPLEGTVLL
ncbi:MAG: [FeFe] hydrogenase H-cluster radical SAM maturase HydE [Candidatus Omnitrophica bacterium]|nr:[FeFe] hydrogenase H-cluster radical SAM maturase HydE [Candidatus Omnitrophota bacterium]